MEVVINDFSNRVCDPNKTEDLNLRPFNMVTGIKGYNLLTKHISSKCEYQASIKQMLAWVQKSEKTSCVQKNVYYESCFFLNM